MSAPLGDEHVSMVTFLGMLRAAAKPGSPSLVAEVRASGDVGHVVLGPLGATVATGPASEPDLVVVGDLGHLTAVVLEGARPDVECLVGADRLSAFFGSFALQV